jgi:endonuclease III
MKNDEKALLVFKALKKKYGAVAAELYFSNLFELTIAVVLSAQTTDRQVNSVTKSLFLKYGSFEKMAHAESSDVEKIIYATGFYHEKARNIIALSKKILETFNGKLPDTREELMTLPGVGRKTANVILAQGFGKPAFAVDTHVGRVSRRIGFTSETDPKKVEDDLCRNFPERLWSEAHLLFIIHGRRTCLSRKPFCDECPVRGMCRFQDTVS